MRQAGVTLHCGAQASHCDVFSCCGARALAAQASVVVAYGLSSCGLQALECRLSSCGAQVSLLRGMWDLPGPGLEPVSPVLAGGFLEPRATREAPMASFNLYPFAAINREYESFAEFCESFP